MRLYCTITEKLGKIRSVFKKCFKQSQAEEIKYEKISLSKIEELDVKTIEYLLSEGNRYIDNQNQTGKEIRTKSLSLLGILSTILISLIGLCVLLIADGRYSSALFFFVLYGIMATGIVSFRLFVGVVYERSYKISGEKPTYILYKKAYNFAHEKGDLHKGQSN